MSGRYGAPPGLDALVRAALAEDVGAGDVTTEATIPPGARGTARVVARAAGVVAGSAAFREVYRQVDAEVSLDLLAPDGTEVAAGDLVARARGSFGSLLIAERTALNFLQRLSGIATLTAAFARAVGGTRAKIVDTRKTTPGWRALEKAAVRAGGGGNHRMGLDDAYLIKENHIAGAGGIGPSLAAARRTNPRGLPVEIEVRSLTGFKPIEHLILSHADHDATNTEAKPDNVKPVTTPAPKCAAGRLEAALPPYSWNVIRFSTGK